MLVLLVKRSVSALFVLLGVSILVFLMIHMMPGDVAEVVLGPGATAESLARLRAALNLDDPLPVQYFRWLGGVVQGDFGMSIALSIPVTKILVPRLQNTLILTAASLFLAVAIGIPAGILAAKRQNSLFDRSAVIGAVVGASLPAFWLGLVLMALFAFQLRWLPALGMYSIRGSKTVSDLLVHLILPAITTSAVPMAVITRLVRSNLIDVMQADYITALRAKGISEWSLVFRHGLRNTLGSVLTITGLQVGYLLGGAVFTEVIFSWPGLGLLIYDSIIARDMPVVQAAVLVVGFFFVLVNLLADMAALALDPKAR